MNPVVDRMISAPIATTMSYVMSRLSDSLGQQSFLIPAYADDNRTP